MELYKEILAQILINQDVQVTFPGMNLNVAELIEMRSYQALKKTRLSSEMTAWKTTRAL